MKVSPPVRFVDLSNGAQIRVSKDSRGINNFLFAHMDGSYYAMGFTDEAIEVMHNLVNDQSFGAVHQTVTVPYIWQETE